MSVVIASEALVEIERQTTILRRAVGQLMASPVVFANRNGDILVDVEGRDQALREDIDNVIVTVRTVVKVDSECVLPLLCLQHMVRVKSMKHEPFKLQFADGLDFRTNFEIGVEVVTDTVLPFEKADLGVEVRSDFSMVRNKL